MAKKILVIDDDRTGSMILQSRLGKEGYSVSCAENGVKGLEAAQNDRPDLIVLDVEMPEMNGYTFMMEMKKIDSLKAIPVIVLTSHEENKAIFFRRGVQNYLPKPVNFDVFLPKIRELIGAA